MVDGTGEGHPPVVCGQYAADFSVGECGGSIHWRRAMGSIRKNAWAKICGKYSNLRGLSDAYSFFLHGPKEGEIDPFRQGLGG
jgi:hypothetical protein